MNNLWKQIYRRADIVFPVVLCIVFAISFSQVFDEKVNVGGDNATYYLLAKAISTGQGYVTLYTPDDKPTNVYPPGYPLVMSSAMIFTQSITAQKVLNGLLLLGAAILLFFIVKNLTGNAFLSFSIASLSLINFHLLKFATMMMSEMAFLFFSMLTILFLIHLREDEPPWRDIYFYLFLVALAFSFHIRTQGITLVAGVLFYFLFTRRWIYLLSTAGGFFLLSLPWRIRNQLQGIGSSRYLEELFRANPWRPEAGTVTIGGLFERMLDQGAMLITKAIPESIFNFVQANYREPAGGQEWLLGLIIIVVMLYGFWRFKKHGFRYLLIGYFLAVFGIVAIWSATVDNRYLVTFIPFLQLGFFYGAFEVVRRMVEKYRTGIKWHKGVPAVIIVVGLTMIPGLHPLKTKANRPYPAPFYNYFQIASELGQSGCQGQIVACRKTTLFYLFSNCDAVRYKFSQDKQEVIRDLVNNEVDYVVLDRLGFGSTARYLYPAVKQYQQLFSVVNRKQEPDTYLLRFNRQQAQQMLGPPRTPNQQQDP